MILLTLYSKVLLKSEHMKINPKLNCDKTSKTTKQLNKKLQLDTIRLILNTKVKETTL